MSLFGKGEVLVKVFVVEMCYWVPMFVDMVFGLAAEKRSVLVRFVYGTYSTIVSFLITISLSFGGDACQNSE